MADAVGKNDVVARSVEKLARAEQFARENGLQELLAGAAGAMEDQDGVGGTALGVARGLSERCVVKAQLRERFAGAKLEILHDKVAFGRRRRRGLLSGCRRFAQEERGKQANEHS